MCIIWHRLFLDSLDFSLVSVVGFLVKASFSSATESPSRLSLERSSKLRFNI